MMLFWSWSVNMGTFICEYFAWQIFNEALVYRIVTSSDPVTEREQTTYTPTSRHTRWTTARAK